MQKKNKGYLGEYANGEIIGTIPQYISINNGKTYIPVTNMFATYFVNEEYIRQNLTYSYKSVIL